ELPAATLHASHAPLQEVLQQTPSTQLPELHSKPLEQEAPFDLVETQLVPLHQLPLVQSVLLAQVAGQALVPLHSYGEQLGEPVAPPARLVQVPLAEAPAATEHASHEPLQAALQQYPSTQLPLEHWLLAVHATPCAFLAAQVVTLQ